ncbi:MAG: hypothetical protein ABIJ05_04050 [Patescibacteria group bacterium]
MSSISAVKAIQTINDTGVRIISSNQISILLDIKNKNTVYKLIQRLEKYKLITRVAQGKYIVTGSNISDFEIANTIYPKSYVSFESALNFYGILSQFPYTITSATLNRSFKTESLGKAHEFTHISAKMFWGYQKTDNFLIATPEKAFIDTLYLKSKGIRKIDIDELKLTELNKNTFFEMTKDINYYPFQKIIKKIKL